MHTFTDINGKADVTWYERSGLIAHKGKLYIVTCDDDAKRLHHAAHLRSRVNVVDADEKPIMRFYWYIAILFTETGYFIDACKCRNRYAQHIIIWEKAQALIRTWASKRIAHRKAKQLAFAMAWHWRLGGHSMAAFLPVDLVRPILEINEKI